MHIKYLSDNFLSSPVISADKVDPVLRSKIEPLGRVRWWENNISLNKSYSFGLHTSDGSYFGVSLDSENKVIDLHAAIHEHGNDHIFTDEVKVPTLDELIQIMKAPTPQEKLLKFKKLDISAQ